MKTLIKAIGNANTEGVTLFLTEKASLNSNLKSKEWCVSWDKIGRALFKDQYSDTTNIKDLDKERQKLEVIKGTNEALDNLILSFLSVITKGLK